MSLLVFFISAYLTQAQGCPDLSGQYACALGSHQYSLLVKSNQASHTVVRDGREMKYEANGQTYSIPDTDSYQKGRYQSVCAKNKLQVNFQVELLYEVSVIAKQKSVTEYEKIKSDVIITEKTRVKGVPLPTQRFVCKAQ
jgi:hypothetical protein